MVKSNGELRQGFIGGEAVEAVKSITRDMCRLDSDTSGEMGVLTAESGGDCISGASASISGV